jgi:hypothetical protein
MAADVEVDVAAVSVNAKDVRRGLWLRRMYAAAVAAKHVRGAEVAVIVVAAVEGAGAVGVFVAVPAQRSRAAGAGAGAGASARDAGVEHRVL